MSQENLAAIEDLLRKSLKSLGYFRIQFVREGGPIELLADGEHRDIMLHVKLVGPEQPEHHIQLSQTEIRRAQRQAKKMHREPWVAAVKLTTEGTPEKSIEWSNLAHI